MQISKRLEMRASSDSQLFRAFRFTPLLLLFFTSLQTPSAMAQTTDAESGEKIAVYPMTTVDTSTHQGYFSDPYLVHSSPWLTPFVPHTFSGTTQELLTCKGMIQPDCFVAQPLNVDVTGIRTEAKAAGSKVISIEAIHPYQDLRGEWNMVLAMHLRKASDESTGDGNSSKDSWSIIVHASPAEQVSLLAPLSWTADTLLIGSLKKSVPANYDGKYFEDGGQLYLLYSKRLSAADSPARDGIVAQRMNSPTQLADVPPVTLLQPNDGADALNSEYYFERGNAAFKLVETGNITKINGKYALAYSTGAYDMGDYKTAVAWSDTFLPSDPATYRKVLMPDPEAVWGNTNPEVRYLLQSQKANWPNYVAAQIVAPGVPNIAQVSDEAQFETGKDPWILFFAAYAPDDAPTTSNGDYKGNYRRPFYVHLKVKVPGDSSVRDATDEDLASWIIPER